MRHIEDNEEVDSGIFVKVTPTFKKYLDTSMASQIVQDCIDKGNKMDVSTLGRFGYLLVLLDPKLLQKHPDLLLASASPHSATQILKKRLEL